MSDIQRIVGLDLSLTATGYYFFDTHTAACIEGGGVVDTGKLAGMERLDHIMVAVLDTVGPKPCIVVIEDFSFASRGQAVFQIGGLGFMVRHALWRNGIPFICAAPSQVKKFATGKGNAEKSLMLKAVYQRWGADFDDDNVADAYTLARIGRAYAGWDSGLPEFQQEVVEKLRSTGLLQ